MLLVTCKCYYLLKFGDFLKNYVSKYPCVFLPKLCLFPFMAPIYNFTHNVIFRFLEIRVNSAANLVSVEFYVNIFPFL